MTNLITNPGTKAKAISINGKSYAFWSDFVTRSTYAVPMDGSDTPKVIHSGGYIHNEKTVRKSIILVFGLEKPTTETTKAKKVLTEEQKAKKAARAKARREARKGVK